MNEGTRKVGLGKSALVLLGSAVALGAAAAFVGYRARKAERENPPIGKFVEVDGLRLHYVERGEGPLLVLLHGNGSMVQDFELSGLIDMAAQRYRVVAFDRPGYGYSDAPAHRQWDPSVQADLLLRAVKKLGGEKPIVLGHSWGSLVTLAMALNHQEELAGIVMLSGFFHPSLRMDAALMSPPAVPVIGSAMRHTISPLISNALWTAFQKRLFAPEDIPPRFAAFPKWMALRPSQLRAASSEVAVLMTQVTKLTARSDELRLPIFIMAGSEDKHVNAHWHSAKFADRVPHAQLKLVSHVGHMMHYFVPLEVLAAVDIVRDQAQGTVGRLYRNTGLDAQALFPG